MKLNHLDLPVSDVPAAAAFFVRYFGLELQTKASSPAIAILVDDLGLTLVLQRREPSAPPYPDGFHVGFYVESDARVHELQRALAADGLDIGAVTSNNRGTMCYCRAPGGLLVEVNCRATRRGDAASR